MGFEAPEVVIAIKDIKAIYDMNDKVNPVQDADALSKDLFTGTATLNGIKRREKLYGIIPKDTDTLEQRRFRVLAKENNKIPYTALSLKHRLTTLCGEGKYSLSVSGDMVIVKLALINKTMYENVLSMLEDIVPLNLLISCIIIYNQHCTLARYSHSKLAHITHKDLRNEVIE